MMPGNDAIAVPLPLLLDSVTKDERRQSIRYITRNILSHIPIFKIIPHFASRFYKILHKYQCTKSATTTQWIPWSKLLVEKLIALQLVKKLLTNYGTRRFITVFTTAPPPLRFLFWAQKNAVPTYPSFLFKFLNSSNKYFVNVHVLPRTATPT